MKGVHSAQQDNATPALDRRQHLFLPMARAAWVQNGQGADGQPELTLYYLDKEVTFDDPRQFAFGTGLPGKSFFRADAATEWSGLGWSEVAPLLASLIDAGILHTQDAAPGPMRHDNQPMPSPLADPERTQPRSWMDEASLMEELTGTKLDIAWLEAVVPVFRTGHLFVDADGRQVGEANVFPASARVAVPTDWRGCPYAGNRYQAEKPMNASALKAMRQHWRPMMVLLRLIRTAYLRRFPEARRGWTVGLVERLSVCVLALPSYLMLRCDRPCPNGELSPVLSNLFRVIDGLRMVMHQMLFVPLHEDMASPDRAVDAEAILAYADRNFSFHSDHGVCAGPRFMVEDMLGVVLEGREPRSGWGGGLDADLIEAVNAIDPAIDYAMLGLQTYGVVFSLWPEMARCYEQLHRLLADHSLLSGAPAAQMAQRFAGHFDALSHRSFLANEEWRQHRAAVYDDMYAEAYRATNGSLPNYPLSAALAPASAAEVGARPRDQLERAAAATFGPGNAVLAEVFADLMFEFLQRGQATLALTQQIQRETAELLRRPVPLRALTLDDLNLHNVLMGEDVRTVPFLPAEIGQLLDLSIEVEASSIVITPRQSSAGSSNPAEESSAG